MRIFVIGFLGTDRAVAGQKIAEEKGYDFFDLDKEIEKKDGRSLLRLCMMMGEHEYRNKEFELLEEYSSLDNIVVACGDGTIFDDMCAEILEKNHVVVLDDDPEILWEKSKANKSIPYAFMHSSNEEEKHKKFLDLYNSRKALYNKFKED